MICEASKRKLTIMFDLHGVANRMPELVKPMMKTFKACGHKVIICSGPTTNKILDELYHLGYESGKHYDNVVSVVDYLADVKHIKFEYDEKGDPWTDDETWFKSKGWIAKSICADIVIDDSKGYKDNMPVNVAFWLWS